MPESPLFEYAGWFLVYSFAIGLACLPFVWVSRRLAGKCGDSLRSAVAILVFLTSTVVPLAASAFLLGPPPVANEVTESVADNLSEASLLTTTAPTEAVAPDDGYIEPPVLADFDLELLTLDTETSVPAIAPEAAGLREEVAQASAVSTLPIVWLCGASVTACVLLLGLVGSVRLRFQSIEVPDGMRRAIDDVFAMVPATRVAVRISELVRSPILLGVVRPVILLPATAVGWTPETLQFVILHEVAHARRWDNLVNLFQRLIETLCFYQPVVWLASSWVRTEREVCCDQFVARVTQQPTRYAETLVHLAMATDPSRGRTTDLVTCSSTRHALVGRVARLMGKEETMKLRLRSVIGAIAVIALGTLGFQAALAQSLDSSEFERDSQETQESPSEPAAVPDSPVESEEPKKIANVFIAADSVRLSIHDRVAIHTTVAGRLQDSVARVGESVVKRQQVACMAMTATKAELAAAVQNASNDIEIRYAKAAVDVATAKLDDAIKNKKSYSAAELRSLKLASAATKLDVERTKAQLVQHSLRANALKSKLKDGQFLAPIDGRISAVLVQPGQAVQAGEKLFEITSLKRLKADFFVPVRAASEVKKGMSVRFEPTDDGFPNLVGKVLYVAGEVSRVGQRVQVTALLDNPTEAVRAGQQGSLFVLDDGGSVMSQDQRLFEPVEEVVIKQRRSKPILDEQSTVALGDITAGRVSVSVTAKSGVKLIDEKPMRLGDSVRFKLGREPYVLRIKQLTNVLVGDDSAVVAILSDRSSTDNKSGEARPAHTEPAGRSKTVFALSGIDTAAAARMLTVMFEREPVPPVVQTKASGVEFQGTSQQIQQAAKVLVALGALPSKTSGR